MQVDSRSVSSVVDRFFAREIPSFSLAMESLSEQIDPAAWPQRDRFWSRMQEAFQNSQEACRRFENKIAHDPDLLKSVRARFLVETQRWFHQSWFGERARTKPSGFPGDYAMLLTIYNQKPLRTGVGGYLDLCLADVALARAVRARCAAAKNFLVNELTRRNGLVRVLNVASGPCQEYLGWTNTFGADRIELCCLDNDPSAIQHVRDNVIPTATGISDFSLNLYNALRTKSADATIRKFGRFDIVYSIGLCDYIPDAPLIAMLQGWRETLNENGVIYVAFKDCRQYDKTPYQWHLDWHFLQRTEEDCWELFNKAGYDLDDMEVTRDDTGIIINFITGVKSRNQHRIDAPSATQLGGARPHLTESRETSF
ncbi:MAG: hypothetical protein O3C60_19060 [Planctomycetota bacterium]|nr:hypothetical protein [Planctomycetota bacterium]